MVDTDLSSGAKRRANGVGTAPADRSSWLALPGAVRFVGPPLYAVLAGRRRWSGGVVRFDMRVGDIRLNLHDGRIRPAADLCCRAFRRRVSRAGAGAH